MQTVGAQWLMLMLMSSAVHVALVQTASSLPIVLLAVFAGTAGDLVDRRRLLAASQLFMLVAAALLGGLTSANLVSRWTILALVLAVGAGNALSAPTWQTLQPELVDPDQRAQAISLGSVNQNLARAVGPSIAGVLLAVLGAAALFYINAASFAVVLAVVLWWHGETRRPKSNLPRVHVGAAVRAGLRYVAASPALHAVLVRTALFVFFAGAVWALLPITAHSTLHLASGGYGLLLGAVGVGALAGAALLPTLRDRFSPGALLGLGSVVIAVTAVLLAWVPVTGVAAVALVFAGAAWILGLSVLNSLYQLTLPTWVEARGLAVFLVVFQGVNALGAAVFGTVAERAGLTWALGALAGGLVLGLLAGLRWHFEDIAPEDLQPSGDWPTPVLVGTDEPAGPVLVTVVHHARSGREDELVAALEAARFSRRRTGASGWRVWRDAADPGRVLEQFVVATWDEHLRQHERVSARDQARLDAARALTDPGRPPGETHSLTPTRAAPVGPPAGASPNGDRAATAGNVGGDA